MPYLNKILHDISLSRNLVSSGFMIVSVSSVLLAGLYYRYLSPLAWMCLQCFCAFIGFAFFVFLPTELLSVWVIIFLFVIASIGVGSNLTYTGAYIITLFPRKLAGSVSSLYSAIYLLFFALVIPVTGWELSHIDKATTNYTISDYRISFLTILFMHGLSFFIMLFLLISNKKNKSRYG